MDEFEHETTLDVLVRKLGLDEAQLDFEAIACANAAELGESEHEMNLYPITRGEDPGRITVSLREPDALDGGDALVDRYRAVIVTAIAERRRRGTPA
jgi:hypothetical protein